MTSNIIDGSSHRKPDLFPVLSAAPNGYSSLSAMEKSLSTADMLEAVTGLRGPESATDITEQAATRRRIVAHSHVWPGPFVASVLCPAGEGPIDLAGVGKQAEDVLKIGLNRGPFSVRDYANNAEHLRTCTSNIINFVCTFQQVPYDLVRKFEIGDGGPIRHWHLLLEARVTFLYWQSPSTRGGKEAEFLSSLAMFRRALRLALHNAESSMLNGVAHANQIAERTRCHRSQLPATAVSYIPVVIAVPLAAVPAPIFLQAAAVAKPAPRLAAAESSKVPESSRPLFPSNPGTGASSGSSSRLVAAPISLASSPPQKDHKNNSFPGLNLTMARITYKLEELQEIKKQMQKKPIESMKPEGTANWKRVGNWRNVEKRNDSCLLSAQPQTGSKGKKICNPWKNLNWRVGM